MKIVIHLILGFMIVSCETIITSDLEPHRPLLVFNSVINPDSTVTAFLSTSSGTLDPLGIEQLTGASISLFENDILIGEFSEDVTFSNMIGNEDHPFEYYTLNYTPKPGNQYQVRVEKEGYPPISATTIIPDKTVDAQISIKRISYLEFEATITINDKIGRDYYELVVLGTHFYQTGDDDEGIPIITRKVEYEYFQTSSLILVDEENSFGNELYKSRFFSDDLFDGEQITFKISVHYNRSNFEEKYGIETDERIYIDIRTLNSDYFNYLETKDLQLGSNWDPFSEPVPMYGNIEGGFGIFGSYQSGLSEHSAE